MSKIDLEEWLHSSDEERARIHQNWKINQGQGKEVIEEIAQLFKDECIYSVYEVDVITSGNTWQLLAYVREDDHSSLKDRENVEFLGFKVRFENIDNRITHKSA